MFIGSESARWRINLIGTETPDDEKKLLDIEGGAVL
jgi:hypothetical protein